MHAGHTMIVYGKLPCTPLSHSGTLRGYLYLVSESLPSSQQQTKIKGKENSWTTATHETRVQNYNNRIEFLE